MLFPNEIINHILMYADVRVAVALGNEHVKKKLLPRLSLPKLWRSLDPEALAWLRKYNIQGERSSVRSKLTFTHPVRELLWWPAGFHDVNVPEPLTATEEAARAAYLDREAAYAREQAAEARIRKRARREVKVQATIAFCARNNKSEF